jgi:hypothetical protein
MDFDRWMGRAKGCISHLTVYIPTEKMMWNPHGIYIISTKMI